MPHSDDNPKSKQPKCRGLVGLILGHSFYKDYVGSAIDYNGGACWRCGWKPDA